MAYAIVINLDYENHPPEACRFLWNEIRDRMIEAGFRIDGRTFLINRPPGEACVLARQVVEGLEEHLDYHRKHLHKYLRDFYGFPAESRSNLLLPPVEDIRLQDPPDTGGGDAG